MSKGTTIINAGVPADLRTGALPVVRNPVIPFRREQMPSDVPEPIARLLHRIQEAAHDTTESLRRLPEGGQRTYFKDVSFTIGVAKTLDHLLGVAGDVTATASPAAAPIALSPDQIRFEILNQRVASGSCYRTTVDARQITLVPSATFTADVRLFVVP